MGNDVIMFVVSDTCCVCGRCGTSRITFSVISSKYINSLEKRGNDATNVKILY